MCLCSEFFELFRAPDFWWLPKNKNAFPFKVLDYPILRELATGKNGMIKKF